MGIFGQIGKLFGGEGEDAKAKPAVSVTDTALVKVGPDSGRESPAELRLNDGSPLYHALLSNPNAPVTLSGEANDAKDRLAQAVAINPDAVKACQGKTRDEVSAALKKILDSQSPDKQKAA